jgi:hypothetical protein
VKIDKKNLFLLTGLAEQAPSQSSAELQRLSEKNFFTFLWENMYHNFTIILCSFFSLPFYTTLILKIDICSTKKVFLWKLIKLLFPLETVERLKQKST